MQYLPIIISLVALTISLSALTVAILNYRRKSSAKVRGRFSIARSSYGEDEYVSSVTLENMKDRPITVLSIHLRVGYNYYVEIEDFEATPLTIKAFESWHSKYEPVDFYAVSTRKIDLNRLLSGRNIKRRLVLSTTDGKLKVRNFKRYWDPVHHHLLRNPLTVPVTAMRLFYKGKAFGGNTKYIIEVTGVGPKPSLVPVRESDSGSEKLAGIFLTSESLKSAMALESFLMSQQSLHPSLMSATIRVVDTATIRRKNGIFDGKERVEAPSIGFLVYHLLSPIKRKYDRFKAERQSNLKHRPRSEPDENAEQSDDN